MWRFALAIAMTSDMKLDLNIPKVYEGFKEWYYTYFVNEKRRGRKGSRKLGNRKVGRPKNG